MFIVILGAGRVGVNLAKQLIEEKEEVVIIEENSRHAENIARQLDCLIVNGKGNSLDILKKANVGKAAFFIATTNSDEINLIACALVSKAFPKTKTIARVRNVDYSSTLSDVTGFFGVDYLVNPDIEVAQAMVLAIEHGATSQVMELSSSNLQIRKVLVEPSSIFSHSRIAELRKSLGIAFIIAALERSGGLIIPNGNTELLPDDYIWIMANPEAFSHELKDLKQEITSLEKIAIVGGASIGRYLAKFLQGKILSKKKGILNRMVQIFKPKSHTVSIIEKDYDTGKLLKEDFPDCEIIIEDVADDNSIEEGLFDDYDLFISTTDNYELNILTAAHAKTAGVPRTMTLVQKSSYVAISQKLGIDVAISINETLVNSIKKLIRGNLAVTMISLGSSKLELLELDIKQKSEFIGKRIDELHLPKDSLVLLISRNGDHIIPYGSVELTENDTMLIICSKISLNWFF